MARRLLAFRRLLGSKHSKSSSRPLSTFADMYRNSADSAPISPGDVLHGHVVGASQPRSSTSRFYIVDFGLKSEAPFTSNEIPRASVVGHPVTMPLLQLEDDFNEPVMDYDNRSHLPALNAERHQMLLTAAASRSRILHGRFAHFKRVGAAAKVLGTDVFVPRHHVAALDRAILGSYAPFYVLRASAEKKPQDESGVDINAVGSSYGGYLFCIANLVGLDSAWKMSGGGTSKERQAYLRLLVRLLHQKNTSVRRILPKHVTDQQQYRRRGKRGRKHTLSSDDAAWLNDLPRGDWASSAFRKRPANPNTWQRNRASTQKRTPTNTATYPDNN
ncbi:hypothetical protein BWQ96_01594 [Gracilariopsis chorda]|uniref:Uncharacterized protein n=1 Tax=Gracilariopsis chorda TaxID=448386 RepID=A0A2V3J3P2_9FLOR|nr:hypothetical protein BWQ96_01594 [Gracilariopsis chorda]|eukprot:PXF48742.1 hypothetical protein BWQ96_01594 [Gracilariopsis chorda]